MLFLQFQIGSDRYALEASRVVEVIPLLGLKKIPHAPRGVAGMFNYRGEVVPALDLTALTSGQPAAEKQRQHLRCIDAFAVALGEIAGTAIIHHATYRAGLQLSTSRIGHQLFVLFGVAENALIPSLYRC